jgi:HD-GYP domain-containing protein (c-di-GMP phosphodiesterase class II)
MSTSEYCEITIEIFLKMTGHLAFDVFIQLSPGKFTQIFKKEDIADKNRIENYLKKGVKQLFIHRKDRRAYIESTERFIKKVLSMPNVDSSEAARAIEELSEQTLFEIFEDKLFDESSIRYAQEVTRSYLHWMKKDIKVLTNFLSLCHNETYMVRHSITTSLFSILLARADKNLNDRTLEIVGIGGLLHDIGMSCLPSEMNDVDRRLTKDEWELVKKHSLLGKELIENVPNFPAEISHVIEQHHENYDGTGYPAGLKGEMIFYPARVVAIADCFSALTTRRGGRSLFSPNDALAVLITEGRKYDPKLLAAFESLLNPKKRKVA